MIKALFTAIALAACCSASAQNRYNTTAGGCGTVTPQRELEKIYDFVQHNPAAYRRGTGAQDTVPLSIHLVGDDNGNGYYQLTNLFRLLCQLNDRYKPADFRFYIQWPIHYINNSAYYVQDYTAGEDMMIQNNVPDAVNVYFVQDPAGNCGYYSYYGDAVSIGKNCAGSGSTTLAHELGHFFSLPHTFSGWEYGTPPDPENVARTGPGANCNSAGDGFCDTYADYLSQRWACPGPVGKLDANGEPYHLDSSMYMSYSLDACQSRFSAQQMAAMQYNLHNVRGSFTGTSIPVPYTLDTPKVIYPVDTMYANLRKAVWKRVDGADYYLVRVLLQSSPGYVVETQLVADTVMTLTKPLADGGKYFVNVVPVNAHNFCMDYAMNRPFVNAASNGPVGISRLAQGEQDFELFPNPLAGNASLTLRMAGLKAGIYNISVLSTSGQVILQQRLSYQGGVVMTSLPVAPIAAGTYWVKCTGPETVAVRRLLIER